jgi:hypothetical protein
MTAQALYPPAAGDRDDDRAYNPAPRPGPGRTLPARQPVAAPFGPADQFDRGVVRAIDVGTMGELAPPTIPSARRLRRSPANPAAAVVPGSVVAPMPAAIPGVRDDGRTMPDGQAIPGAAFAMLGASAIPASPPNWAAAPIAPAAPAISPFETPQVESPFVVERPLPSAPVAPGRSVPMAGPPPAAPAPVAPPVAPAAPVSAGAASAPVAAAGPISAAIPVTYAPAEPASDVETHLAPEDSDELASYITLPGCPHPLYGAIKRWAPAFVPSLEGAAAVAFALALIFRGAPVGGNLNSIGGIPTLLAVYLVGGALFGLVLYFATSDAIWFSGLIIGGLLLPTLILATLVNRVIGGIEVLLALGLGIFILWVRCETVPDNTVAVTKLFGRYFRIVRSGQYLRLPFERVVAALDTHEHLYTAPTQYVEVRSPQGVPYRARANCTAIYAILPGEAHRIVPMLDSWERDLQHVLIGTLREALADWATHVTITGIAPPPGTLARSVLGEARTWAHLRGIWMMRVRVHNIWLEPASSGPWAYGSPRDAASPAPGGSQPSVPPAYAAGVSHPGPMDAAPGALAPSLHALGPSAPSTPGAPSQQAYHGYPPSRPVAVSPVAVSPVAVSPMAPTAVDPAVALPISSPIFDPGRSRARVASRASAWPGDARGMDGLSDGAVAVAESAPVTASPEVLASAYEAIRDGRISDPVTIRGVAQAFARLADEPPAEGAFPFDAAAAARLLWEYADSLDRHLAVSAPAPQFEARIR